MTILEEGNDGNIYMYQYPYSPYSSLPTSFSTDKENLLNNQSSMVGDYFYRKEKLDAGHS